jgi:hypothetical protein
LTTRTLKISSNAGAIEYDTQVDAATKYLFADWNFWVV